MTCTLVTSVPHLSSLTCPHPALLPLWLHNVLYSTTQWSRVCKLTAHNPYLALIPVLFGPQRILKKKFELAANLEKEPKDFYIKFWLANFSLKARFDGTCPAFSQAMPGGSRGRLSPSGGSNLPSLAPIWSPIHRTCRSAPSRLPNPALPLERFLSYLET